jgi:hypothetical protein
VVDHRLRWLLTERCPSCGVEQKEDDGEVEDDSEHEFNDAEMDTEEPSGDLGKYCS